MAADITAVVQLVTAVATIVAAVYVFAVARKIKKRR